MWPNPDLITFAKEILNEKLQKAAFYYNLLIFHEA